jgi:hypothetical protein
MSDLSQHQQKILKAVAQLSPRGAALFADFGEGGRAPSGTAGSYRAYDVARALGFVGGRLANVYRSLRVFERRGLISRHGSLRSRSPRYFTLTDTGLRLVNQERKHVGMEALEVIRYASEAG